MISKIFNQAKEQFYRQQGMIPPAKPLMTSQEQFIPKATKSDIIKAKPHLQDSHNNTKKTTFTHDQKIKDSYKKENIYERIERLKKIKNWIFNHQTDIEKALYNDFKKPGFETQLSEILTVENELNFAIKNLKCWAKTKKVKTPTQLLGHSSYIKYEPKGTVLIISPWNYPFQLCLAPLIAALAAGNTVILKPSELTPHTSRLIEDMLHSLFSEHHEVQVVQGDKDVTTELLKWPFDHVFFTGSTAVGKIIAEACAKQLIPYSLELGGKCPVFIDQTAHIQDAALKIFWGKYLNRGQTCVAPDLIFVHQNIKKDLLTELNRLIKENSTNQPAAIITQGHEERLKKLCHNQINFEKDLMFFIEINTHNKDQYTDLLEEEIFGPISPIIEFNTYDDCKNYVKENPLALYIFSEDKNFIANIINQVPSGDIAINTVITHLANPHLPFGGKKQSGQGKYHGHHGFIEFSHPRSIMKHWGFKSLFYNFLPPYNEKKKSLLNLVKKI